MRQQKDDVEYKVLARGPSALPCEDAGVLRDYFNAGTSLQELSQTWASKDPRFCNVHPYFPGAALFPDLGLWCDGEMQPCLRNTVVGPRQACEQLHTACASVCIRVGWCGAGARVLRQDPLECLFQFVCSSNNHISRIHGMVERLCRDYGTPLPVVDEVAADGAREVTRSSVFVLHCDIGMQDNAKSEGRLQGCLAGEPEAFSEEWSWYSLTLCQSSFAWRPGRR